MNTCMVSLHAVCVCVCVCTCMCMCMLVYSVAADDSLSAKIVHDLMSTQSDLMIC